MTVGGAFDLGAGISTSYWLETISLSEARMRTAHVCGLGACLFPGVENINGPPEGSHHSKDPNSGWNVRIEILRMADYNRRTEAGS